MFLIWIQLNFGYKDFWSNAPWSICRDARHMQLAIKLILMMNKTEIILVNFNPLILITNKNKMNK